MNLVPAYGRDYKNKTDLLADFDANKDFIFADISSRWNDKPVNKRQLVEEGVKSCTIRYKQLRNVAVVKIS